MNRRTASIWILPFTLALASCTALPKRSTTDDSLGQIIALTEPSAGTTKRPSELETQEDEEQFIVEAWAIMKQDRADKARIRCHVLADYRPRSFVEKLLGRRKEIPCQ